MNEICSPEKPIDADIVDEATEVRRDIHSWPELAFQEQRTSALVADRLKALGLDVTSGIARTGVVGVLDRGPGPFVAFRADMDALPISEQTGAGYASRNPGVMHACGHDGHTACLLAAAAQLVRSADFAGTIAFVFQPAEENEAGAKAMMEDGLFDRFPISAIYGAHNFPKTPVGEFTTCVGPMMASFTKFDIRVKGSGGHSSQPHLSRDALRAAIAVAEGLPDKLRRGLDPLLRSVISITALSSDGGYNVIPSQADIKGSFRALDTQASRTLVETISGSVNALAATFSCVAQTDLALDTAYPVTMNSAAETAIALSAAHQVVPAGAVEAEMNSMFASEDFAFYLTARPGNFMGFGNGDTAGLHTPEYDFNDRAIPLAAAYWFCLAHMATSSSMLSRNGKRR